MRSASFDYDVRGNITRTVRVLDGATYTTDQTYDSLNRIETVTYPDTPTREVVTQTYNSAGSLATVTGVDGGVTTNDVTDIQYDAFSKRTRLVLGNGTQTDYTYDADTFRLQQLRTLGPGGVLQHLNYTYDAVGNVQTIRDGLSAGYNESFDYDDLHRLTGAFGAYGSLTYAYNQIGNMTCNSQLGPCSATSANYAYPPSGVTSVRPHAVNQAGPYTYTYDANGNMTSGAGRSLTYDVNNRPTSMTVGGSTVAFAYDYSGERVRKQVVGGAMTTYVGAIYECAASCTKYLFAGSTRVAQKTSDGTVAYFHGNHLGSTHVVTNSSGTAVEEIHYYPYGGTYSDSNGEAGGVNRRYTGQEIDIETGLYYYHARYYDPVLGRFISADTGGIRIDDPQTLNRYSYVLNNPLRFIDPNGQDAIQVDEGGSVVAPVPCSTGVGFCGVSVTSPSYGIQVTGTYEPGRGQRFEANPWVSPWTLPGHRPLASVNLGIMEAKIAAYQGIECSGCSAFERFGRAISGNVTSFKEMDKKQARVGPIGIETTTSVGLQVGRRDSLISTEVSEQSAKISMFGVGVSWPLAFSGSIPGTNQSFSLGLNQGTTFSMSSTFSGGDGAQGGVIKQTVTYSIKPFINDVQEAVSAVKPPMFVPLRGPSRADWDALP
ncbi:MAG: RHS repeat domain-containing protein [Nitrospirota bacterium]